MTTDRSSAGPKFRPAKPVAVKSHERGGVLHRHRLKRGHVHQVEEREIEADADGQDEDGGDGECRRAPQDARGVPHVLNEAIEPAPAPGVARFFAEPEHVAERAAVAHHLAMRRHLGLELPLDAGAIEQIPDPTTPLAEHARSSQADSIRNSIARVVRRNSVSSVSSCFRPLAVR